MAAPACPLCGTQCRMAPWHVETRRPLAGRPHYRCSQCGTVFVPSAWHITAAAERAVYDLHENDANDEGYARFLSRALAPILRLLPRGSAGLDFGCGPGPLLAQLLQAQGMQCQNYDLYYEYVPERLQNTYDFIVSTEVFEHLAQPQAVLQQLCGCLRPGGLLVIMTQRPRDIAAYSKWQYILDPTHITFYSEASFHYIANHWPLKLEEMHKDVVVFRKA